jgi:hypothetical protein
MMGGRNARRTVKTPTAKYVDNRDSRVAASFAAPGTSLLALVEGYYRSFLGEFPILLSLLNRCVAKTFALSGVSPRPIFVLSR